MDEMDEIDDSLLTDELRDMLKQAEEIEKAAADKEKEKMELERKYAEAQRQKELQKEKELQKRRDAAKAAIQQRLKEAKRKLEVTQSETESIKLKIQEIDQVPFHIMY